MTPDERMLRLRLALAEQLNAALASVKEIVAALKTPNNNTPPTTRAPLARRLVVLREFLAAHGPATRAQIVAITGIPGGSLSALLLEPDFVRTGHGTWALKSKRERGGP